MTFLVRILALKTEKIKLGNDVLSVDLEINHGHTRAVAFVNQYAVKVIDFACVVIVAQAFIIELMIRYWSHYQYQKRKFVPIVQNLSLKLTVNTAFAMDAMNIAILCVLIVPQ